MSESQELEVFTSEEFGSLQTALAMFFADQCSSYCLDNDEERETVAEKLAHWLLTDKTVNMTPDVLLPKAQYHAGIRIVDEASGQHIITLNLNKSREMTQGDFLQMQNFFWTTIGRAVRDNPEIVQILKAGGVDVDTDPGDLGGQQFAP